MQGSAVALLNRKTWVNKYGEVLDPFEMEKEHVMNCLNFLYRKRDWLMFNSTPEIIRECKDPDEFFQKYVKNSIIWNTMLKALEEPEQSGIEIYRDCDVTDSSDTLLATDLSLY